MAFVKFHSQQAVNAAAADSARCWRRWAKEACQGSAGAAHGFSKAGLDSGDGEGLAGPQLLVNQMGTWLPLWLDPRRANAKQLADQEEVGEPLPRPTLEEVDNVCKTYKHTAGLGHDCISPKAILKLPVELRVRFIDLLMAFEAKLVKPLNWSHMMVLRPKPPGGHRTIGLTVAPLRVLSRLRRPLAQQWENEHDAPYFWGCQGKACDRAAWAHSIVVAAAKGRQQSAASLLLDLAKFYEHVGHDHLWEEGRKTRFSTRLLACWCASYEGWRFLEADKCATFPFWAFGTILPGCSGATTAAKLMLATLLETVAKRLPTYRLWNVVDDISGHVAGTPKMVQVITAEAARLLVEGLQARDLPLSKGRSKVLIDGSDKLKQALLQQLEEFGIDESNSVRNVGADLQLGRRRRALVVKERLARAAKRTKRVRQLRKAGAHTGKLTLTGSNAGVLWGFRGSGLHSNTAPYHQSRRCQSHIRLSRGQNAATTMLANAQASGGKNIDPAFRHHRLVILAWRREFGKARQTSIPCRPRCAALWPGSVVSNGRGAEQRTQRPPSCSRSCDWAGARSLRGTLRPTTAPRSTSWPWRPKRWACGWTRHPFCGLTALHTGISPRARFSGKPSGHSSSLANWKAGHFGIGTCSSSWSLEASGHRKGWRGSGERSMAAANCATMDQAPCSTVATNARLCRQKGICTSHRRCAVDSQYGEQFAHGIFPDPGAILPTGFPERQCQVFWHNRPPDGLLERHIFTDGSSCGSGALRRAGWAVVAVNDVGNLKAAAYGAVPSDLLPGQSARDGEDYAAAMAGQFTLDPLTLYIDSEGTIATINGPKHKALGARGPRAHVWNRLLFSHDEVKAVKVKGHATQRDVEAGRTSHLCKKGNDLADSFAKKGADTHKPAFRVAKSFVACASLAKQAARWAAEAHVLLRFREWNDTRAAVQRARARLPRARLKRKRRSEIAAPTSGQVCDWLSPIFPHFSRKTVTSTLVRSEGTACNWDEFSMREAEHWTTPSFSAPSVELSTGSVRTHFADNAANPQVAERRSCAN